MKGGFFHSIKKASKIFRHKYDSWFCVKKALKRAKSEYFQGFADIQSHSKTVGRGFESSCPFHNRSQTASVFLLSGVFTCFSVWNAFFDGFSGGFFMDTRVSSFCLVQRVTIIPFGTSSKKHQGDRRFFLRSPFSLSSAMQFLCLHRQKSLVIPLSILVSFLT